jgi:hypothetical protein|tara:strand:+ start:2362 stop:3450 length:1089 start_codon:yes stop_codon:yes gene_type:complete
MTASRRKYAPGVINQFKLAGQRLGLNLGGLFEDDEDGNKAVDGFMPSFTEKSYSKSRGNVLSYLPQARSGSTTEFNLTPETRNNAAGSLEINNTNTNTNPNFNLTPEKDVVGPTAEELAEQERQGRFSALTDLASQYGRSSLFGHQDYLKAKEGGYSDTDIKDYLTSKPGMLGAGNEKGNFSGLYEQINRGAVNTAQAVSRDYATQNQSFTPTGMQNQAFRDARSYENAPQISTGFGGSSEYFGAEDYDAAKMSGYGDDAIKSFLSSRLDLVRGDNAPGGSTQIGQLLNEFKPPSNSGGGGSISTGAGQSAEYFGHKDVEAAKASGASNKDIARYLQSNQGQLRGGNVAGGGGLYDEYRQYM